MRRFYYATVVALFLNLFIPAVLFPAFAQSEIPLMKDTPLTNRISSITVTQEMIDKGYYYRIYYIGIEKYPIYATFYNKKQEKAWAVLPQKLFITVPYNRLFSRFYLINSWRTLEKSGEYLLSFISSDKSVSADEIIQKAKLSSNTKKNLKDGYTLIVDDSTGVAPLKGTETFNIRYELRELSDMKHKIKFSKDDTLIYSQERKKATKGTKGFDWTSANARKGKYKAVIYAESVADKNKWDNDLSEDFEALK